MDGATKKKKVPGLKSPSGYTPIHCDHFIHSFIMLLYPYYTNITIIVYKYCVLFAFRISSVLDAISVKEIAITAEERSTLEMDSLSTKGEVSSKKMNIKRGQT